MINRSVLRCCGSLTILTLLTGCHLFNDDEPSIDRSSGPLSEQRYQWTAGPGIDLVTGPAVPIRAYMESRMDAQTMGTIDYAYPGFDRAVATKSADGDQDLFGSNLRPDEDTGAVSRAAVGNNRFLIQSLTRSGQTVTATLCNYRYGLAHEQENGTFVSVLNKAVNDQGIDTLRVRLTAPADESNNALPPQAGPAPAPAVDVFGDWKITGLLTDFGRLHPDFPKVWPTYEADLATCIEKAPDLLERRAFLKEGEHPRTDFPTSAPSPGWPKRPS